MTGGGMVGAALILLTAAMPERRGGGDFDLDSNYYGKERDDNNPEHNIHGGPVIEEYNQIAHRTIGRWAGDRIAIVGDYAEDSDLPRVEDFASSIYHRCLESGEKPEDPHEPGGFFKDVTDDVCRVIEHENRGKFFGAGWRDFVTEYKAEQEITHLEAQIAKTPPNQTNQRLWLMGRLDNTRKQLAELKGESVTA
jgi:hypothetical protein